MLEAAATSYARTCCGWLAAKAFMAGGYGALSLRDAEDVGSALNVLKNLNF